MPNHSQSTAQVNYNKSYNLFNNNYDYFTLNCYNGQKHQERNFSSQLLIKASAKAKVKPAYNASSYQVTIISYLYPTPTYKLQHCSHWE